MFLCLGCKKVRKLERSFRSLEQSAKQQTTQQPLTTFNPGWYRAYSVCVCVCGVCVCVWVCVCVCVCVLERERERDWRKDRPLSCGKCFVLYCFSWSLVYLFLIFLYFCGSGGLCFVIVAFPGNLHIYFYQAMLRCNKWEEMRNVYN